MKYQIHSYVKALVKTLEEKSEGKEAERVLKRIEEFMHINGDEQFLSAVFNGTLAYLKRQKAANTARIVSAVSPDEKEKQTIRNSFPAKEYVFEVNKNILGGLVMQKGTKLYNYTLRNTLERITRT